MFTFVVIMTFIIALSIFMFFWIWWIAFNNRGEVKFRLRMFKNIFLVKPERWEFQQRWSASDDMKHLYYDGPGCFATKVKLSFPAFIWFLCYHYSENYRIKKIEKNGILESILETYQNDINKLREESEKEIEQALKQQKEIMNDWRFS